MNASVFDADLFLNVSAEGEMATRYDPIPAGVYVAIVGSIKARQTEPNGKNPNGQTILDVVWSIDNPAIAEQLNRKELTVRQSIFLDLTPQGGLDLGANKNVQLGRLRDALDQNAPGKPWSPRMLQGAGPVNIEVTHNPDKNDASIVYERVNRVSKLTA